MNLEEIKNKIFSVLNLEDAKTVYEIAFDTGLSVPTVHTYLKLLEVGQFVKRVKSKKSRGYVWMRVQKNE